MAFKTARRGMVPPFMAMEVMREAADLEASGQSIIHLEVGQPSTGLPDRAVAEIVTQMECDPLGYTVARGVPGLRNRIVRHYADFYGVNISPDRVFATTGSSAGFILAFVGAFEAGERVALATPGYPAYRHILTSLGIVPELIAVDESTRYQPTVEHLKSFSTLPDGLILGSPANPTGSILPEQEFRDLVEFCEHEGVRLISDEIYHGITYGMNPSTAAGCSNTAIVVNSFSKYFCMTGWRLGWMIVPDDLIRSLECLAQSLFIAPPTASQYGGMVALDCRDELDANVQRYARNREILLNHLPSLGFEKIAPADGAFYIYADISALSENSEEFCRRLLHEAGIATTPGVDFDPARGRRFIRLSFAGATEDMEEACARLKSWRDRL